MTTTEAATLAGVSPATIRSWAHRGWLTPTGTRGRDTLYDPEDVITVEAGRWATGKTCR